MNPKQCFQHHIWSHFKYWNHQEKKNTKKKKNGTKHITKRTSVYRVRIKTRRQSVTLLNHSWRKHTGWLTLVFFSPPLCRCLQMVENELQVLILVVLVSFSKQITSQVWNPWITRLNWMSTSLLETRKTKAWSVCSSQSPPHIRRPGKHRMPCRRWGAENPEGALRTRMRENATVTSSASQLRNRGTKDSPVNASENTWRGSPDPCCLKLLHSKLPVFRCKTQGKV